MWTLREICIDNQNEAYPADEEEDDAPSLPLLDLL